MKIISAFLIASLLFSIGCYSRWAITKEELDAAARERLGAGASECNVRVFMNNSVEYRFDKGNYHVHGDSLTGFGVRKADGEETRFDGSIALSEVTSLKTSEFMLVPTIIAIALPPMLLGGFLLALAIGMSGH